MSMDFLSVVKTHAAKYPLMEPQDYVKLAFQNEFGPEHMIRDILRAGKAIQEEWSEIPEGDSRPPEPIGNGLCRFHFSRDYDPEQAAPLLAKFFSLTAEMQKGSTEGFSEKLEQLREFSVPGMEQFLKKYRERGCPMLHHSESFQKAYAPHYRLLRKDYAVFFPAMMAVWQLMSDGKPAVVSIDGRCGSGKTQLAALAAQLFPCRVLHMDDFYLPIEQRGPDWRETAAGNMDLSRFLEEVLLPASGGGELSFRPYDCQSGKMKAPLTLHACPLTIVEGSYSQHPALAENYALKIFLTCSMEEQEHRLKAREGDYFQNFTRTWIPLEEQYFRICDTEQKSNIIVDTTDLFN